jgi:uncharacterized protein YkwD
VRTSSREVQEVYMPRGTAPALFLLAGILTLSALGGCPAAVPDEALTYNPSRSSGGVPPPAAGPGRSTTAEVGPPGQLGADDSSFINELQQRFPACDEPAQAEQWRAEILALVNAERQRAGLNPVVNSAALTMQATQYACEMIQYDFFDHVNPVTGSTLGDRAREFGYEFYVVGENLGAGQATPQQVFRDWMNSPGHRRNVLDPRFVELGVGVAVGGRYQIYWVQEFGRPLTAGSAP